MVDNELVTAVLCSYEELLIGSTMRDLFEPLDDAQVALLLRARYRRLLALGYSWHQALRLAVGLESERISRSS
jgi:hypothetical protein